MPTKKQPTSFRFSDEAGEMLERLAGLHDRSKTMMVERLIREAFLRDEAAIKDHERRRAKASR